MARGILLRASETIVPEALEPAPRGTILSLTRLGWGLALPVLLLTFIGLLCVHVTEPIAAAELADSVDAAMGRVQPSEMVDENWIRTLAQSVGTNTAKQLAFIATGLLLLMGMLFIGYQRIGRLANYFYAIVIALLALIMIDRYIVNLPDALVPVRQGNVRRWITFGGGFGIQPSEFMKLALVLALARYLRYRDSYRSWRGLIPPFLMTLVPAALILKQPNLGTCLLLMPILFAVLFMAGARLRHLIVIILLGACLMPIFYFFGMREYQRERVLVLLKQNTEDEAWQKDQGYQLRLGKVALATGGVWGRGYGEGEFVSGGLTLPAGHNDFIFSIIGHQFGFIGCVVIILCYVAIVICGIEIATATNDPLGKLIAIGVIAMIVFQALLNIATNVGIAPITGVPLPFVSAGGSSLWANMLALGLLINVAQRRPMLIAHRPFEHADS